MRARSRLPPLALLCACAAPALLACGDDGAQLSWQIGFESSALRTRAALIEARVVKGGCDGSEILYVSSFAPDVAGASPPELGKGRYGLVARAQDADCLWYAQGCTALSLPRGGDVMVMIGALADETLDCDACDAVRCRGGSEGGRDADVPIDEPDAGPPPSGGSAAPDDDAGVEPPDASAPPDPVVISLEAEGSPMVQPPLLVFQDDLASGGAYISYPWDANLTTMENQALKRATPPADDTAGGLVFLEFDVPRSAQYRLWGRVIAPTLDEDSFWMRIDDGEWLQWNDISHQDQTWHWDDVRPFEMRADRFVVELSEGRHVLRVSYRELGAKLDRVVVASELDWVPTE